jgi:outer membrane biosynthesis protein TonB
MLKNKIILAVIAVIIALGLAGCRAEKDNVSSVAVNAESSITETVSDISETPADASSNKTAEITEKPESSAPTGSSNETKPMEDTPQNKGEPKNPEKPKTPTEPETRKTESEKPPAPTESVSKPEEIQIPSESSVPEKQEPEFNIDYYIKAAQEYAVKSGLKIDPQAKYCWDNPIAAGKSCRYTERDIKWYIDKYAKAPEITAVWIWAEENGKDYEIYIGYA